MRLVPVDAKTGDWPRKIAQTINTMIARITRLESATTYTVDTITLTPTTAPTSPVAGMIYYDSGTNKARCFNGTIWNDLW